MNNYPGGIHAERRNAPLRTMVLIALCMLVCAAAVYAAALFSPSVKPTTEQAQAAGVQVEPSQTASPAPTATVTPNRLLETVASYNVDEAKARAERAVLENNILVEKAKQDALYQQELHNLSIRATQTAIANQQIAAAEEISITRKLELERAQVEITAIETRENLYIGGRITMYFVGFIAALVIGALVLYAAVTAWRQAGQPEAAEMAEYIPPEPSQLEVQNGNQLRYPLKGTDITSGELCTIAAAKHGRSITFRDIEAGGITSERWEVVRDALVSAEYLFASGNQRIRVVTTDEGEGLLKLYSLPRPAPESTQ